MNSVADDRGKNGGVTKAFVFGEETIRKCQGQPKGMHDNIARTADNRVAYNRGINRRADNRGIHGGHQKFFHFREKI